MHGDFPRQVQRLELGILDLELYTSRVDFFEFEFRAFTFCAEALTFGGLGFFFGRLSLWGLVAASCSTSCSWHIG